MKTPGARLRCADSHTRPPRATPLPACLPRSLCTAAHLLRRAGPFPPRLPLPHRWSAAAAPAPPPSCTAPCAPAATTPPSGRPPPASPPLVGGLRVGLAPSGCMRRAGWMGEAAAARSGSFRNAGTHATQRRTVLPWLGGSNRHALLPPSLVPVCSHHRQRVGPPPAATPPTAPSVLPPPR